MNRNRSNSVYVYLAARTSHYNHYNNHVSAPFLAVSVIDVRLTSRLSISVGRVGFNIIC